MGALANSYRREEGPQDSGPGWCPYLGLLAVVPSRPTAVDIATVIVAYAVIAVVAVVQLLSREQLRSLAMAPATNLSVRAGVVNFVAVRQRHHGYHGLHGYWWRRPHGPVVELEELVVYGVSWNDDDYYYDDRARGLAAVETVVR